jgi:hypothetical protein
VTTLGSTSPTAAAAIPGDADDASSTASSRVISLPWARAESKASPPILAWAYEPVDRDDLVGVDGEDSDEGALLGAADLEPLLAVDHLQQPEHPNVHR